MVVIAGKLKGRRIPFINKKFGNADITPQKLKGALFSIIGGDLFGKSFLDLYACSGQIGIEAISRGAEISVINEAEKEKFSFIQSLIMKWGIEKESEVFNFHAFQCLRCLSLKKMLFDYIFIDPPYSKIKGEVELYADILNELSGNPVINEDGVVIIQHFSDNDFSERYGKFRLYKKRKYGNNSISFFRIE